MSSETSPVGSKCPRYWCDFNSAGVGGERDDDCFYSFRPEDLRRNQPVAGLKVFLYQEDGVDTIVGCEAHFEPYRDGWLGEPFKSFRFCGWRARPVPGTWYQGPLK